MKASILRASVETVGEHGLSGWTVDLVAQTAGCAKGLVPYHHGSKQALLHATVVALAARHAQVRQAALAVDRATGAAALDALWEALRAEVASGAFAAWTAVLCEPSLRQAARTAAAEHQGKLIPLIARALALPATDLPGAQTVAAVLDGCQLRLLQGAPAPGVLDAYERLWLGLLKGIGNDAT